MLPERLTGFSSKSYLTLEQAEAWIETVARGLGIRRGAGEGTYICVPFPLVERFRDALGPLGTEIGTQDVSAFPAGPYTGEVTAELLAALGSRYTMVGHPERRRHLGESEQVVRAKIEAAVDAGIVPILVCGETTRDDDPVPALTEQVATYFGGLPDGAEVIAAYEPTWAIGQPEPAPAQHVAATVEALRGVLEATVSSFRIVYGGSAVPGTYADIVAAARNRAQEPDGIFLGRGGLDPAQFLASVDEVRASAPSP
ncbi:triose-phosphate isomerase family protein [Georgenia sp. Z1491]|uniref:triose-phosphate isomerase family protein n=1 Tax=Georgenia sp. Z1491 TaxID=3416707 RepID=UPI003CE7AD63